MLKQNHVANVIHSVNEEQTTLAFRQDLAFIFGQHQEPMSWEHATPLHSCHGVFIDRFIFRSNLLWMRLPWECHNQSHDTNWRHCVTGPELRFFHKRKGVLKIDQSVKMPWHRLRLGVASSCSSAADSTYWSNYGINCFILSPTFYILSILSKHLSRHFSYCVMYWVTLVNHVIYIFLFSFLWLLCWQMFARFNILQFPLHDCTVRNILKPPTSRWKTGMD